MKKQHKIWLKRISNIKENWMASLRMNYIIYIYTYIYYINLPNQTIYAHFDLAHLKNHHLRYVCMTFFDENRKTENVIFLFCSQYTDFLFFLMMLSHFFSTAIMYKYIDIHYFYQIERVWKRILFISRVRKWYGRQGFGKIYKIWKRWSKKQYTFPFTLFLWKIPKVWFSFIWTTMHNLLKNWIETIHTHTVLWYRIQVTEWLLNGI